jgi:hypothetical protein
MAVGAGQYDQQYYVYVYTLALDGTVVVLHNSTVVKLAVFVLPSMTTAGSNRHIADHACEGCADAAVIPVIVHVLVTAAA